MVAHQHLTNGKLSVTCSECWARSCLCKINGT